MPSLAGGTPESMLRRFPAGDERWQVSASGGWWPRWSRDGTRIFYVTSEAMYEVAVRASADGVELSRPRRLLRTRSRPTRMAPTASTWPPVVDSW
jgi:Tol biopolymer transport system component